MQRIVITTVLSVLLLIPASASAKVKTTTRTSYYNLAGSTIPELQSGIAAKGPDGFAGYALANISWRYKYVYRGNRCGIKNVVVTRRQTYTMPAWAAPEGTAPETIATWNAFLANLWVHEKGHGSISRLATSRVHSTLLRFGTRPTCSGAGRAANRAANVHLRWHNAAHLKYDKRTDHGATQGATLVG